MDNMQGSETKAVSVGNEIYMIILITHHISVRYSTHGNKVGLMVGYCVGLSDLCLIFGI